MIKIITFPVRYFVRKAMDLVSSFIYPIREKSNYVFDYFAMLPGVSAFAGIIMAIVQLIRFIAGSGYKTQIGLIKEDGVFKAFSSIFTAGTVPAYYNTVFCIAAGALILVGLTAALIEFFRCESTVRKVFAVITFALGAALIAASIIQYGFIEHAGDDFWIEWQQSHSGWKLSLNDIDVFVGAAGMLALIGCGIIVRTAPMTSYRSSDAFGSAILVFALIPLVLLLVENVFGIVLFAAFTAAAFIFGDAVTSSDPGKDGSSEKSSEPAAGKAPADREMEASPCLTAKRTGCVKKDGNAAYIPMKSGFRLVVRTHLGTPWVYTLNRMDTAYPICRAEGLANGTYKIFDADTNRRITFDRIPHES